MTRHDKSHVPTAVPWWGRLELRVIAALSLLGILCVGASAYLVQLAVGHFDARLTAALRQSKAIASAIEPFHRELVEAHITAFQARARRIAIELAVDDARAPDRDDGERLAERLAAEPDLVALVLERPDGRTASRNREDTFPPETYEWYDVEEDVPRLALAPAAEPLSQAQGGRLRVSFHIDPDIDARYQSVGEHKRVVAAEQSDQARIEAAVVRVIGLASVVVLLVALLFGFAVVRTMTRKASELSRVMRDVGRGELGARARVLGRDELGLLAQAFNAMLDELARAQANVAYLQRIGAWQEMARRIAHEIKNPLTPIQLAVQQLRDKDPGLSPEWSRLLRASVEIVEDEIAGLRRMVTSFSQFAKVPQVRLEPVSLARVLGEFERAYGHLTEEADDALVVRGPDEDVRIQGDRQLLKQVLVNLVENAVLSAREAGVDPVIVHVTAERDGDGVLLFVDDNGPGIAPERLERVFEPYETTREQGTGLGLAIVKKVVLDHGGEVSAENGPLGGARFRIRLPLT